VISSGSYHFHFHMHGADEEQLTAFVDKLLPSVRGAQAPQASTGSAQAPPASPAPAGAYQPGSPWGRTRLEWLHKDSWGSQHAILTRIASASSNDTVATRQELLEALIAHVNQPQTTLDLRANLAWISRYAVKITGHKQGPFTKKDRGPKFPDGERYTYAMDKGDALAWLEIVAMPKN
jgi:hypothetical protein